MSAPAKIKHPALNPRFIHRFHSDFEPCELARLRVALDIVPANCPAGRAELWARFERDEATVLIGRNVAGELAFFAFYELRKDGRGNVEFFVTAAAALQPSHTLTETSFPQFEQFARLLKCQSVATSTPRLGLLNKVLKMPGWNCAGIVSEEFILRKLL